MSFLNKEKESLKEDTKTAMISQPMNGLSDAEILNKKMKIEKKLINLGYSVINTYFEDHSKSKEYNVKNIPLYFLAKSLNRMSHCNTVLFCKGWDEKRGCKIEHAVAEAYGLEILYEENLNNE